MSMATVQRLAARVSQTCKAFCPSLRSHHSVAVSLHCQSLTGAMDSIPVPPVSYPGREIPGDNSGAAIRSHFMQLMAVPKRKVSPSRKGKRNGPKALKPVPVVAKCNLSKVRGWPFTTVRGPYRFSCGLCCSCEGRNCPCCTALQR